MASVIYRLFHEAMAERKPIVCMYRGYPRALCPIILGHTNGEEMCLVYQFAGQSSRPLTRPEERWRCFSLAEVTHAELADGPWHDGGGFHRKAQSCVKEVDVDVNPDSPYSPKRKLPWQKY
jgi:hypothetical protein